MAGKTYPVDVAPKAVAVRAHLRTIIESPAFRGSRRSQEFLQFIVNHALHRHFDDLKERKLGIEIFGRPPSYDTGEDAIVRVTACDVRKRLHHFYAEFGGESRLRVDLPTGSYIPEFRELAPETPAAAPSIEESVATPELVPVAPQVDTKNSAARVFKRMGVLSAGIAAIAAALWAWNASQPSHHVVSVLRALPWSALNRPNRPIQIVFCDPEIVMVQRLLGYSISVSDYANQHYWPAEMQPELKRIFQTISFRGSSVAAVDAAAALRIEDLLVSGGKLPIQTHTARNVRLADFKSDDSFILLGSPRSNPWVELFRDQLDFTFEFDASRKSEFVQNRRPLHGESAQYVPTAEGFGTGHAYAIIALVSNPEQSGRVLLLAGSNAEATEAASRLAATTEDFSETLKAHAIDPQGPERHFEILLRVSTMAGSPNNYDVIAFHTLKMRSRGSR